MLFTQTALKANKMRSSLPISATGGHNDRTDLATIKVVAATSWLLGNFYCLCQK